MALDLIAGCRIDGFCRMIVAPVWRAGADVLHAQIIERAGGMKRLLLAAALCGGAGACAQQGGAAGQGSGQTVRVSPTVWSLYKQYSAESFPLYFAISADGEVGTYNYCPDTRCVDEMSWGRKNALSNCSRHGGKNCRIFAFKGSISVPYEVRAY